MDEEISFEIIMIPYNDVYGLDNSSSTKIALLAAIAIFILIIACFNYINLVTARSVKKLKEIGVRKVLGAEKRQIIRQNMVESFMSPSC